MIKYTIKDNDTGNKLIVKGLLYKVSEDTLKDVLIKMERNGLRNTTAEYRPGYLKSTSYTVVKGNLLQTLRDSIEKWCNN